jgi:hypothetical protein
MNVQSNTLKRVRYLEQLFADYYTQNIQYNTQSLNQSKWSANSETKILTTTCIINATRKQSWFEEKKIVSQCIMMHLNILVPAYRYNEAIVEILYH